MSVSGCLRHSSVLALLVFVGVGPAQAQGAAEYAGAVSKTRTAGSSNPAPSKSVLPSHPPAGSPSPHLVARTGEPTEVINRRSLEEHAGKDAAKLLLWSVPNGARVWIEEKFVGTTPLLLILAPGSYRVEMRGSRMQFGRYQVDLLPQEKREVVLTLAERYPTEIRLR